MKTKKPFKSFVSFAFAKKWYVASGSLGGLKVLSSGAYGVLIVSSKCNYVRKK